MDKTKLHDSMQKFFEALELQGRASTAKGYVHALGRYDAWLQVRRVDPIHTMANDILEYQKHLATSYRKPNGQPLKRSTQSTWLSAVKSYYDYLYRRGVILHDPASKLKLPKLKNNRITCDPLSQQEAMAMMQVQAQMVTEHPENSQYWAMEFRNLALIAMAIATGRRTSSLTDLRVKDLDFARNEVRVEWEKGRAGRVLPCARWAMKVAKDYLERARPLLLEEKPDRAWLFVGQRTDRICVEYLARLVHKLQVRTAEENPDLEELASKKLKGHSLRVTFATMMFLNRAGIRIVNELLLHKQMSTSARYTPLELDDLRRACRLAHPRA